MQVTESFSVNGKNAIRKVGLGKPGVTYNFNTGHTCTVYFDGDASFLSRKSPKGGRRCLNLNTDAKVIAEMREAVKAHHAN